MNKKYIYETHLHTSEGSACGRSRAIDIVDAYKAAGYTGIIITDHFSTATRQLTAHFHGVNGLTASVRVMRTHLRKETASVFRYSSAGSPATREQNSSYMVLIRTGFSLIRKSAMPM